jgi:hypothetical protein
MMQFIIAFLASLLLSSLATAASNVENYIGRTLLLHVADDKSVALDILADGKVRYIDARIDAEADAPAGSYVRQVRYRMTPDGWFCVVRERDTCFELPELKTSEIKRVKIKAYDVAGQMTWSGEGLLMLLETRSSF